MKRLRLFIILLFLLKFHVVQGQTFFLPEYNTNVNDNQRIRGKVPDLKKDDFEKGELSIGKRKEGNLESQKIAIPYDFDRQVEEDSLQYQLKIFNQGFGISLYKNNLYLLIVALVLIIVIVLIIMMRVRKIHEHKRKRALEIMRNNIARDLHDDIGSTLSSIQIMSSMALKQCNDNPQLRQSLFRISELSDKVADGIREIVWSINPIQDKLQAVILQMRKLAADVLGTNNIAFKFIEEIKDPEREMTPQQRKELIMIFKEAINNARKYSGTQHVDISIKQDMKGLIIHIKDYGCGFDTGIINFGNGLGNMKKRATEINALFALHTRPGNGTFLSLQMPLS